jgi:hypothetical protein
MGGLWYVCSGAITNTYQQFFSDCTHPSVFIRCQASKSLLQNANALSCVGSMLCHSFHQCRKPLFLDIFYDAIGMDPRRGSLATKSKTRFNFKLHIPARGFEDCTVLPVLCSSWIFWDRQVSGPYLKDLDTVLTSGGLVLLPSRKERSVSGDDYVSDFCAKVVLS